MAQTMKFARSFNAGEITPRLFGRVDSREFQTGLQQCLNMLPRPEGALQRRPGTKHIAMPSSFGGVSPSTFPKRLIPFQVAGGYDFVIEVGHRDPANWTTGYFRFIQNDAVVLASTLVFFPINNAVTIDTADNTFAVTSGDDLQVGATVQFAASVMPAGLSAGVDYRITAIDNLGNHSFVDPDNQPVNITTTGTSVTVTRHYLPGETASNSGTGLLYIATERTTTVPGAAQWTQLATNGAYLLPNIYGPDTDFSLLKFAQDQTELVLTHPDYPAQRLTLMNGADINVGGIGPMHWKIEAAPIQPSLATPAAPTVTEVVGERFPCSGFFPRVGTSFYTAVALQSGLSLYAPGDLFQVINAMDSEFSNTADLWRLESIVSGTGDKEVYLQRVSDGRLAKPSLLALATVPTLNDWKASVNAGANTLNWTSGRLESPADDKVVIVFSTTGTTGLSPAVNYYIINYNPGTGDFQVEATPGGGAIGLSASTDIDIQEFKLLDTVNELQALVPASPETTTGQTYVVSAVDAEGNESLPSPPVTVNNNLYSVGSYNEITPGAHADAARFYIYRKESGLFGFIGQVDPGETFEDRNTTVDSSRNPKSYDTTLEQSSGYPASVANFEQRICYGGTIDLPQTVWMSEVGSPALVYSIPVKDSERIRFRVSALRFSEIRHLVPLENLVVLTSTTEYRVGAASGPVTPTSQQVRAQSTVGASHVTPLTIDNNIIFCAARGGHVRELGYRNEAQSYVTGDLSLRAAHLFDGFELQDAAVLHAPWPLLWFVSTSGKLLSITYLPAEQIGGWAQHDLGGPVIAVSGAAQGTFDTLYMLVDRNGTATLESFSQTGYLDRSVRKTGAPFTTVTGLDHLNGQTVRAVLADGSDIERVVSGGAISVPSTTLAEVGVPFNSRFQTLPLSLETPGFAQGRALNINEVSVRRLLTGTGDFYVGPSDDRLTPVRTRDGVEDVPVQGSWGDGSLIFEVDHGLAFTVVSLTYEVSIGGM